MTILTRRNFLRGLIAAPAIIPIHNLMRISPIPPVYATRTITLTEYAELLNKYMANSLYEILSQTMSDQAVYGLALTRFDGEHFERYDHANRIWRRHSPRAVL